MKYTFKHLSFIVANLIVNLAHGQTTPIDQVAPGPHIFFEARNIKTFNDASTPNITFDLYMSASQAYVDVVADTHELGFQSCDIAFDVDFGTDGTQAANSFQSVANEATVVSNQISGINAPVNLAGDSPGEFDTRFKYVVIRDEFNSAELTTTPTHVGSVKVTWAAGTVIGTPANGAKIQIRSQATGFNTGPTGSKWGDFSGNVANTIGASSANAVPLPVKLANFDAQAEGKQVNLIWSTTEEVNSDHFDIERSKNGKQWVVIKTVKALGESKALQPYQTVDSNPIAGNNLYRLHIVDKDGSSTYSAIRNVKMGEASLSMYPNPVSNVLTIDAAEFANISQVRILNGNGKEVYQSGAKPEDKIDVSKLGAGMYIVSLRNLNGEENNYKIVVTK